MAEKIKTKPGEELVDLMLFKDGNEYKDDLFVGVNGRTFQIRRGVPVKVPKCVYKVIMNAMKQEAYAVKVQESLANNDM